MSQTSRGPEVNGSRGERGRKQPNGTPAGFAVLMLAVFVVIGVGLLHALDETPSSNGDVEVLSAGVDADDKELSTTAKETSNTSITTNTTLPTRSPSEVKVLVANGVRVPGAAAKVASHLQPVGYQLLKPGNTDATQNASAIQYVPGYQAEALAVATTLGIQSTSVQPLPTPAPVKDLQSANVLVIVGNELANSSSSTSSTAATSNNAGPLGTSSTTSSSTTTTR